jgi:release factor glutamine methyltransferase
VNEDDTVTWAELLERTAATVGDRAVARWLCERASGEDGADFAGIAAEVVAARQGLALEDMVRRVLAGEPVQYALGRWAFRRLDLLVDRRVLIPRPETELVVDLVATRAADLLRPGAVVVDLGTGSGALGLSILDEFAGRDLEVWMTDVSTDALDVARANAAGLGRAAAGARFAAGSWWEALPAHLAGHVRVAVANPPYIAPDDPEVDASVRDWEPAGALFSGRDGLADIAAILAGATTWLAPGGLLVVEHGHRQASAVVDLAGRADLVGVDTHRDLAGRDRFLVARRAD